jgi:hypothetical protein
MEEVWEKPQWKQTGEVEDEESERKAAEEAKKKKNGGRLDLLGESRSK